MFQTKDKIRYLGSYNTSDERETEIMSVRGKVVEFHHQIVQSEQKKEYYDNRISACKGNTKESWKTINELLNKRSKSSNIDCLKDSCSDTVHRKDIPDAMNSYFCSVGKDLADKISPVANPLLSGEFEMNKTKAKFHFRTIEVQEVRDAFAKACKELWN